MRKTAGFIRKNMKEKYIKILAISFIVIALVGTSFFVWYKFFSFKKIESFIPEDPVSVLLIDIRPDSDQNLILAKLGQRFGEEKLFSDWLASFILPSEIKEKDIVDKGEFLAWTGERLAIGKIKISSFDQISFVICQIKNKELALEQLAKFEEAVEKVGYAKTKEEFRKEKITTFSGKRTISYAVKSNYLLISETPEGVKKMLDVASGRISPLSSKSDYLKTKKKLDANKHLVFAYLDLVELVRLLPFLSEEGGRDLVNKFSGVKTNFYIASCLSIFEDGIKTSFSLEEVKTKKKEKTKLSFLETAGTDLSFFYESKDLSSLVQYLLLGDETKDEDAQAKLELVKRGVELEFGINMDEDIFPLLRGNYALILFPEKDEKNPSFGLVIDEEGVDQPGEKMKKLEKVIGKVVQDYFKEKIDISMDFQDKKYEGLEYRYTDLGEKINSDLVWGIYKEKLVVSTSEKAFKKIVDSMDEVSSSKLVRTQKFIDSLKRLGRNKEDINSIFYLDFNNVYRFLEEMQFLKYESINQKLRKLDTLVISGSQVKSTSKLEGFLKVK